VRDREIDAVEVVDQDTEAEKPRNAPPAAWDWRLRGWARDRDGKPVEENFATTGRVFYTGFSY
jgi:hypothetical protein